MSESARPTFVASLEGIRGYAFLIVFLVHYTMRWTAYYAAESLPLAIFTILSTASVPMFFALSGYLITELLCRTAGREGFFRVYYWRRALRILPAYYVVLALALGMALWQKVPLHRSHLLLLVYGQNLSLTALGSLIPWGKVMTTHLWSMSVEEQFYVAWPVVMFLCGTRRQRLVACYVGIAAVNVLHFCWPLHGIEPRLAAAWTPLRADTLMMGSALALHRQGPALHKAWRVAATWGAIAAPVAFLVWYRAHLFTAAGNLDICGVRAVRYMYPCLSVIGLAVVVAALEEGTLFKRICEFSPMCRLGRLSYGMYLFHLLYLGWFSTVVVPWLFQWMRLSVAILLSAAMAFLLTLVLASACYRWVEMPALRLRTVFEYGAGTRRRRSRKLGAQYPFYEPAVLQLEPGRRQAVS